MVMKNTVDRIIVVNSVSYNLVIIWKNILHWKNLWDNFCLNEQTGGKLIKFSEILIYPKIWRHIELTFWKRLNIKFISCVDLI